LCCKTGTEFSTYYKALEKHSDNKDRYGCYINIVLVILSLFHRYQWYCHFDDDIYVNVPQLSSVLQQYDPSKPYYIGKYPWIIRHQYDKHPYLPVSDLFRNNFKSLLSSRLMKKQKSVSAKGIWYASEEYPSVYSLCFRQLWLIITSMQLVQPTVQAMHCL